MWLHVPKGSEFSLSSQAWGGSILESEMLFRALALCATVKGKSSRPAFWRRAWRRGDLSPLRFGVLLTPSTPPRGEDESMSSPPAGHVLPSPSPESDAAPMTRDGSGDRSSECFARVRPDGSVVKMSAGYSVQTLGGNSESFSGTWPRAGSMRSNGFCFERPMFQHRTGASGSSFWATAQAHDGRRPGSDATSTQGVNLKRDAELWPTPNVPNGGRVNPPGTSRTGMTLNGQKKQIGLEEVASRYFLQAPATSEHGLESSPSGPTSPPPSPPKKRLNFRFVLWMMGLPEGWLDLIERTR